MIKTFLLVCSSIQSFSANSCLFSFVSITWEGSIDKLKMLYFNRSVSHFGKQSGSTSCGLVRWIYGLRRKWVFPLLSPFSFVYAMANRYCNGVSLHRESTFIIKVQFVQGRRNAQGMSQEQSNAKVPRSSLGKAKFSIVWTIHKGIYLSTLFLSKVCFCGGSYQLQDSDSWTSLLLLSFMHQQGACGQLEFNSKHNLSKLIRDQYYFLITFVDGILAWLQMYRESRLLIFFKVFF
jgi:hypothetical protein